MHYFDNAATTRVLPEAAEAALIAMTTKYGNPSSLHKMGFEAEKHVTQSRRTIAKALGCQEKELYFTSGATESNNIALFGAAMAKKRQGRHIVTTQIEHASVSHVINQLEQEGFSITRIPAKKGQYDPTDFAAAVTDETILVSSMFVNNETGLLLPIAEIAAAVKRKNPKTIVHVDAVQAFCKLSFSVNRLLIDLLSFSGHKIYAPKGIGGLYIRSGVRILPHSFGGGHEKGIRPGTESVPLIMALAKAVELTYGKIEEHLAYYQNLQNVATEQLSKLPGISFHSNHHSVPYIINFSVPGIRSEIMLHFLEGKGFCVSSGSACSKGKQSGVLQALGYSDRDADSALRISFSMENTTDELLSLIAAIAEGQHSILKK